MCDARDSCVAKELALCGVSLLTIVQHRLSVAERYEMTGRAGRQAAYEVDTLRPGGAGWEVQVKKQNESGQWCRSPSVGSKKSIDIYRARVNTRTDFYAWGPPLRHSEYQVRLQVESDDLIRQHCILWSFYIVNVVAERLRK